MRKRTILKRTKRLCLADEAIADLFDQMKGFSDESTEEGNSNHQEWLMALAQHQVKVARPTRLRFWTHLQSR